MKILAVLPLVLVLSLAGCTGSAGAPDPGAAGSASVPAEAASIIGTVKQVDGAGAAPRLLVEQVPTRSAGYPIAWIDVTPRTRVLVRTAGETARGAAAHVAEGARVQVWFTGPVRESWPVQAEAGTILVER